MSNKKAINPVAKYSIAAIALVALIAPVAQITLKESEGAKSLKTVAAQSKQIQQNIQPVEQKEIFPVRQEEMCARYQNKTKEEILIERESLQDKVLDPALLSKGMTLDYQLRASNICNRI